MVHKRELGALTCDGNLLNISIGTMIIQNHLVTVGEAYSNLKGQLDTAGESLRMAGHGWRIIEND